MESKVLPWQIISVLLSALLTLAVIQCNRESRGGQGYVSGDTTLNVPGDVVAHDTIFYPVPKYVDTGSFRWDTLIIDGKVDSNAIYAMFLNYLLTNNYDLVLKDDTSMFCRLIAKVRRNKLEVIRFMSQNRRPRWVTYTYEPLNPDPEWMVYCGAEVGLNPERFGIAPGLVLQRGKTLYFLNYDIVNKDTRVGVAWRLFQSKTDYSLKK